MAPALTYDEALAYLAQFINYEARQPVAYAPEHFNVQAFAEFLQTLGAPHLAFPSVHIAGSKGKGSTAAMVAAMLSQAGLRTGLFTSPHLVTFRERMQIDRQLISREEFATLVSELQARVEVTRLAHDRRFRTFFELTTALAFLYFARHQVDIAVVEVGLGGRLDTTNVLTPQVAVLTPIGLEHTRLLGNTLAAIAGEKAGIIKPHSRVVSAPQAPEVVEVFARRCQDQDATLLLAERDFQWHVDMATCHGNRMHFDGFGQHLRELASPLAGSASSGQCRGGSGGGEPAPAARLAYHGRAHTAGFGARALGGAPGSPESCSLGPAGRCAYGRGSCLPAASTHRAISASACVFRPQPIRG